MLKAKLLFKRHISHSAPLIYFHCSGNERVKKAAAAAMPVSRLQKEEGKRSKEKEIQDKSQSKAAAYLSARAPAW